MFVKNRVPNVQASSGKLFHGADPDKEGLPRGFWGARQKRAYMDATTFDKKNLREQASDGSPGRKTAAFYRHAIRDGAAASCGCRRWNGELC